VDRPSQGWRPLGCSVALGTLFRPARATRPGAAQAEGRSRAYQAIERGRFPQLGDRNDLWRLLVFITTRKIAKVIAREQAAIRGGGAPHEGDSALAHVLGREPSAAFAAEIAETVRDLLESLGDDDLRRVAIWKMEGYTNEEIAVRLRCSLKTVSNRLKLIRLRLGNRCRGT
jgi:DNA-directed RNA polymerase specialized sigma24 family protein